MITPSTRAHLMAARDDVHCASDLQSSVDLRRAVAHIDLAMMALCPHPPMTWNTRLDAHSRSLTTCDACDTSWYAHADTVSQVPYGAVRQEASYMASLHLRLQTRAQEHGFAYVTPMEGERLLANDLYQPGHTIHRFSTMTEDRSDVTLDDEAGMADFENEGSPAPMLADEQAPNRRLPGPPRRSATGKHVE